MFFTAAARWKSIPCLWQINLGETNKHKNHCWQVPLLSQLILLRSVQQHGDFGSEATSESLFPPQNLILSCELDPALQLGNRPSWKKKKKTAAFFSLIFLFFGKGSVVSQAWCFTTPEQWRWHKVGQHPVVLGMEGLHGVAQAQITASAASYCSC